jgi:hypothetical protein
VKTIIILVIVFFYNKLPAVIFSITAGNFG